MAPTMARKNGWSRVRAGTGFLVSSSPSHKRSSLRDLLLDAFHPPALVAVKTSNSSKRAGPENPDNTHGPRTPSF